MPESGWEAQRAQPRPAPQYEREFTCTEVEVFCGPSSKGPPFKKVRKDKRESHHNSRLEDPPPKLRERPSWLSISRQPSSSLSSGSWRPVTCNLQDERGEATLRLFTEDQHLHSSIQISNCFAPCLRIVDSSLFTRPHVLVIHAYNSANTAPQPSTSNTSATTCEPVYLAFRSRDTLSSWLVLLRSFARADIRPHPYPVGYAFPQHIGYRIWRQLQIAIFAGRKLSRHVHGAGSSDESVSRDGGDASSDRWEGMFEISLNGLVVGRTGYKFLPGPAWLTERITINDPPMGGGIWAGSDGAGSLDSPGAAPDVGWSLGPLDTAGALLEIRSLRPKSGLFAQTTSHMGTVPIDLGPFRRGEAVKAWWPGFSAISNEQNGELLLEIKFDEEIVLPLENYSAMKDILARKNYFELWNDLTKRIPIPAQVSTHLISLALYHGNLAPHLAELARSEIISASTSPSTLFRGNSTLTRVVESAMAILGAQGFLDNSIGHVIRDIYRDKVTFETCQSSTGGPNTAAGIIEGADVMTHWLRKIWDSIWRARNGCPDELRHLFYHIRTQVEARWGSSALHTDLKYQAISAFLFLRFFIPALLRPEQYGLTVGPPPDGVERSLKSLARALQSLANLNTNVQREEFMRGVKAFNEENVDAMIDYLTFVSTPSDRRPVVHSVPPSVSSSHTHTPHSHTPVSYNPSPELQIRTALQARLSSMDALHRESLPILPYMTDEARDLAVIASAVVRNAHTPSGLVRLFRREIGPMNEGLESLTDGALGVNNVDTGDEQSSQTADTIGDDEPEVHEDVVQFIKTCFDIQAEAMRRVLPNATTQKKLGRRRRRPTKQDDNPSPSLPDPPRSAAKAPLTESSYDGREFGTIPPSIVTPDTGAGTGAENSSDQSTRPDISRQPSQNTLSGTKKKRTGGDVRNLFKWAGR
ncbi:unnamed protein product [Rhizoctonia solani]|uniref:Ras-GAP domain-containing protein n=1 Tax=Rhizoctonia solani TaxID=456999 RepID=A0A8H3GMD6_9AGAM|nr:unnamed protein product [Rhizoctonia solani]